MSAAMGESAQLAGDRDATEPANRACEPLFNLLDQVRRGVAGSDLSKSPGHSIPLHALVDDNRIDWLVRQCARFISSCHFQI